MADPSAHIIPRDLHFELESHADRAWLDDDVLKTILVDAMAVMLPVGERYFIRSLRHFEERIPDAFVRLGIAGYAAQEAFHTREHEAYNSALRALGYDTEIVTERVRQLLRPVTKHPMTALVTTCAIEHITYSLSRVILDNPELFANAKPAYRMLWNWHSLEEVEHANVALTVLAEVGKNKPAWQRYVARCAALNTVTFKFLREVFRNTNEMKRVAGITPGWRSWSRIAWMLVGRPGWVRLSLPHMLAFYRPGYGRGTVRDKALITTARARLDTMLAARPAQS